MIKSHIQAANDPVRVMVFIDNKRLIKLKRCLKHGQIGAKHKNPWKRKLASLRKSHKEKPSEKKNFYQRAIANN